MVVSKSSEGKGVWLLIVYDLFSGMVNAYPATSKGSDFVYSCLRHFVGLRFKNPDTVCRSDAAPELVKTNRDLGLLPETALPRRRPHNSKCERVIRIFDECCRCLRLQAGFAVMPRLWPITCLYAAVAISIDKWENTFGTEFRGANYALGQLVFYRTKPQYKPKIDPNASPALMAGWKLEFGLRYKGVLSLLDYQSLREGKSVCVQAPAQEVYTRDKMVLFLRRTLQWKHLIFFHYFSDPLLSSRFMAIHWPAHRGRIICQKSLQRNWVELNFEQLPSSPVFSKASFGLERLCWSPDSRWSECQLFKVLECPSKEGSGWGPSPAFKSFGSRSCPTWRRFSSSFFWLCKTVCRSSRRTFR